MADVRVGIVTWNTAALLDRCLEALPAALDGLDAEVVVVDNASTDGSAEVADKHRDVQVVRNDRNVGYARAMNQALAGTSAPLLLALNPDTEPAPGSLTSLIATLRSHPDAGVVVPRLVHPDGSLQHSCYRFPTVTVALVVGFVPPRLQRGPVGRRWWLEGSAPHDEAGPIDWAIGAVHAIRAEALAGELPYDERWFMYVEDIDLCWRMHQRGWQVRLEPSVEVVHVGNASGAQAWGATRAQRYWRATYDFVARTRGPGYARALAAMQVVVAGLVAVVARLGAIAPGSRRGYRRQLSAELRAVLPTHLDVARHGAPPPDPAPDIDA